METSEENLNVDIRALRQTYHIQTGLKSDKKRKEIMPESPALNGADGGKINTDRESYFGQQRQRGAASLISANFIYRKRY